MATAVGQAEAEHGFAHSWAFTFSQPQVIRIKSSSLEVVERNCVGCHEPIVASTFLMAGNLTAGEKGANCTRCHSGVGHPPP